MSTDAAEYDLQVWMKSSDWHTKKKLDIIAKVGKEDHNKDSEQEIYDSILKDVSGYLLKKSLKPSDFLSIPEYFEAREQNDKTTETNVDNLFMLENTKQMGFNTCSLWNQEGLDYEQSVLAVSALARFHAATFCFRKEEKVNLSLEYPAAKREVLVPKISNEAIVRLGIIFEGNSDYSKYSKIFIDAAQGKKTHLDKIVSNLAYFAMAVFCLKIYFSSMKQIQTANYRVQSSYLVILARVSTALLFLIFFNSFSPLLIQMSEKISWQTLCAASTMTTLLKVLPSSIATSSCLARKTSSKSLIPTSCMASSCL